VQTTQQAPAAQSPLLTKTWYTYYVLVLLTLGYVINTMDRSQILAAALQAIKKEFNASDFQMGMLTGVPFAVFYAVMGIPIAAWADRSSRRNVRASWALAASALRPEVRNDVLQGIVPAPGHVRGAAQRARYRPLALHLRSRRLLHGS